MPEKPLQKKFGRLGKLFKRRRETPQAPSSTQSTEIQSPETGNAELGSKPSPIIAAEPYAPPLSAADASQARTSTDSRVTNNRQAVTPPGTPSPDVSTGSQAEARLTGAESADKEADAVPTSQRLWNAAFDALERDNADLVRSYVKILGTVLDVSPNDVSATDIPAELHDPIKRQMHMTKLVEAGQEKISRASKVTDRLGTVADTILSVKRIIDLAVQSSPQAALPWAGVCVGLQVSYHF